MLTMQRGEVWWVQFDPAVGSEIRKLRPAVIISNAVANQHLARVVVVPVSSNVERCYPSEARITIMGRAAKAMADQIMSADKSRLREQADILGPADLKRVDAVLALHLGLTPPASR